MTRILFAAALAASTAACAIDAPELSSSSQEVEIANRLSVNALGANRLSVNRLSVNRLSVNGLASDEVNLLAADEGGREFLSYLVSCALPADATLTATGTDDARYTFAGSLGLAPAWIERVPTLAERRWVSACLLARTNLFGVQIRLSLRGTHPALATTASERAQFPYFEGTFHGDLWAEPRDMRTCSSHFSATDQTFSTLPSRKCSVSTGDGFTACGFTWDGICEDVCRRAPGGALECAGAGEVVQVYLERLGQ